MYMVASYLQWWPLYSSVDFNSVSITKSMMPLTIRNRFKTISNVFKQNIYNQCKSFSDRGHLLESLSGSNYDD